MPKIVFTTNTTMEKTIDCMAWKRTKGLRSISKKNTPVTINNTYDKAAAVSFLSPVGEDCAAKLITSFAF